MTSIRDILVEHNIPLAPEGHHHVRPGWIGLDCPYCGRGTQKWHLGITEDGRAANCWRCGRLWSTEVLHVLTNLPWRNCHELLGDVSPFKPTERPAGKLIIPQGVGPLLSCHRSYLSGRGFDPEKMKKLWGLGGIGLEAKLAWRLFIPIFHNGRIVSWTTRGIGDKGRRYINARPDEEETPAKAILYGCDYARHAVIVVEGPTDVWRIGPGAVATMGLAYSKRQVAEMAKFPVRVVCFDSEPIAQKQAAKLCGELSAFPGKTVRVEVCGKDPGETSAKEIRKLRRLFLGE